MSDYIGVVTNAGQAKIAAAIGGTALNLTTIRVGDGNGAPITPNPAMADLVRRVGAAYPIVSSGRDPVNANHWRVTALIPVDDGPFDIREIGVWDAAGDMLAVAKHVLIEKRTPAQGAAVELLTDIVFPVSETAQVTVQVTPSAQISIFQLLRAGFTVVESATVTAPPAAPALGRTHVVPAGATGAWAGLAGMLVQWNGIVWVAVDAPVGFLVVDASRAVDHSNFWLRRAADGWISAKALETAYGVTRHATPAETQAGLSNVLSVTPAGLAGAVRRRLLNNLTIYINDVDGNDSNDGTANTAAGAFKSIQGCIDRIASIYDTGAYTITLKCAAGTYAAPTFQTTRSLNLALVGEPADASLVNITCPPGGAGVVAKEGCSVLVDGFEMIGAGIGLDANNNGTIRFQNIHFSNTGGGATANYASSISQTGPCVFKAASAPFFVSAGVTSSALTAYQTLTFANPITWSQGFAVAGGGQAIVNGMTYSSVSNASGPRFLVNAGGMIFVAGGGDFVLPGSTAGTKNPGGIYD